MTIERQRDIPRPASVVAAAPPRPPRDIEERVSALEERNKQLEKRLLRMRRALRRQETMLKVVHEYVLSQKRTGAWWRKMLADALYHTGKTLIQFLLVALVSSVTMAFASPMAWKEMTIRFWSFWGHG